MARRTVLALGVDDWARCRFVRSRLFETAQAIRILLDPRPATHQRAWLDTLDQAEARTRLVVLNALNPPSGWIPDFLAPPAQSGERSVEEELDDVASYRLADVATDLQRSLDSHPTRARRAVLEPLIAEPGAALETIVSELHWAWTRLIAPFWSPVHELITADIAYRSREISRSGLGQALSGLHSAVTWRDAAITIEPAFEHLALDLAGRGLTFMPSAFLWPAVIFVHETPWPPTLVYPARGVGDLWSAPPAPPAALAGVLGPTRALLLADLAQPATTTALAARHRLSPAAVSAQLTRLRDAGLVTRHRLGKEVLYQRTPLAEHLIHPAAATSPGPHR